MDKNIDADLPHVLPIYSLLTMSFNVLLVGAGEINFGASIEHWRTPRLWANNPYMKALLKGRGTMFVATQTVTILLLIDYSSISHGGLRGTSY